MFTLHNSDAMAEVSDMATEYGLPEQLDGPTSAECFSRSTAPLRDDAASRVRRYEEAIVNAEWTVVDAAQRAEVIEVQQRINEHILSGNYRQRFVTDPDWRSFFDWADSETWTPQPTEPVPEDCWRCEAADATDRFGLCDQCKVALTDDTAGPT